MSLYIATQSFTVTEEDYIFTILEGQLFSWHTPPSWYLNNATYINYVGEITIGGME